ncbi:hypothetical protein [Aurantimonas marianensis]|uniref:Uncharacterized protein n=1 Tax=Aurantimonas marianensis TaxID=2920428 RepID=A0A9X2KEZ8_9HYPH|nr:hypothetical protein [Aurantimonas marianensis]MCP3054941.1 hypothetical protein [Aurantimonas marianensis]
MSDNPTEDERTAAIFQMAINNIKADRDLWKGKYRILKRILAYHGIEIIEDDEGTPDIKAMRKAGVMPPRDWAPGKAKH